MPLGNLLTAAAAVLTANMPLAGEPWPPFMTGQDLLSVCHSEEPAALGQCQGYILGVTDVLGGAGARVDGVRACLPGQGASEPLSTDKLTETVLEFLDKNPQLLGIKADGLVAYALSLDYPCE